MSRLRLGRVLVAILALQALALLGCAELNKALGMGPKNNKPVANASPTATATPSAFMAQTTKALNSVGKDINTGIESTTKSFSEAKEAVEKAVADISGTDERAVGQASSFKVISENGGLILEGGLVVYVNKVANVVAFHGKGTREPLVGKEKPKPRVRVRRFFVGVLDTDEMNAFALPGGYLYVTRGLLQNLSSESELAWILGHEIAHVDHEHGLKALKVQVGAGKWAEQVVGVKTSFDDPNFFAKICGKMSDFMIEHGFGKADEMEADKDGLEYAVNAGYDAKGAERALRLLATKTRPKPKLLELKNHATPEERLAALQSKIDEYTKKGGGKVGAERFENTPAIQRLTVGGASGGAP